MSLSDMSLKWHILSLLNIFISAFIGMVIGITIGHVSIEYVGFEVFYGGMFGGIFFVWTSDQLQNWVEERWLDEP